ncbi:hypothetical protein BDD43_0060 [Mucilaginibacter gracilis]|uniref:Uncharacterized protein n=1 Tax=Mucilaginibacter gracilis TaxID=423350 RepID=A0A495IVD4_9SPHI|nr:hypothetical protein [Mucilaginibacter gracilis]RKR79974.1 hypothetical protein BDD43_0060 [Mucilaginibacter gracilis]
MKTAELENKKATTNTNVNDSNPVTAENKTPRFVAGNPVNKDSAKPDERAKPETDKPVEQPKAEPAKTAEAPKAAEVVKPVLNLEGTLKLVEELHRRKVQRDKLLETITNLEAFEVAQDEETELSGTTKFSRCELTIEDDKGRTFTTKNPVIIFHVAQYVNALCVDKLAQIEAGITIPA